MLRLPLFLLLVLTTLIPACGTSRNRDRDPVDDRPVRRPPVHRPADRPDERPINDLERRQLELERLRRDGWLTRDDYRLGRDLLATRRRDLSEQDRERRRVFVNLADGRIHPRDLDDALAAVDERYRPVETEPRRRPVGQTPRPIVGGEQDYVRQLDDLYRRRAISRAQRDEGIRLLRVRRRDLDEEKKRRRDVYADLVQGRIAPSSLNSRLEAVTARPERPGRPSGNQDRQEEAQQRLRQLALSRRNGDIDDAQFRDARQLFSARRRDLDDQQRDRRNIYANFLDGKTSKRRFERDLARNLGTGGRPTTGRPDRERPEKERPDRDRPDKDRPNRPRPEKTKPLTRSQRLGRLKNLYTDAEITEEQYNQGKLLLTRNDSMMQPYEKIWRGIYVDLVEGRLPPGDLKAALKGSLKN